MVELRKRKTPPPAPEKPSKKKTGPKAAAKGAKAKPAAAAAATEAVDNTPAAPKVEQPVKDTNTSSTATNGAKSSGKPEVGKTIDLDGFGGEIETNDGTKTSLKRLVDDSKAGVVLFTYPKASTPGCEFLHRSARNSPTTRIPPHRVMACLAAGRCVTKNPSQPHSTPSPPPLRPHPSTSTPHTAASLTRLSTGTKQACLFRDSYTPLTATGLSIYGLSADSPKSNTTFKTKQNLPYPLLCDPSFALIKAIGLAKPGNAKGTVRGVFVVDKAGKVLAAEPGGPDATVEVVRKLVGTAGGGGEAAPADKNDGEDKKDGEEKKADKSEGNGEEVKADGDAK